MSDKEFVIPFVGLKRGMHEFDFEIGNSFFEGIEYSIIEKGKVNVHLSLDKRETMLVGVFTLEGTAEASCGRCMEPVDAVIEGEFQLVYKYDDKPSEDESLVIIYPEEYEINVKESILEFISVSLPTRTVHKKGECNTEVTDVLSKYQVFAVRKEENDDFDDDEDDEFYDDSDEDDNDTEVSDDDSIAFESQEDSENEEQLGDDEYVDPRWEALRKLKK